MSFTGRSVSNESRNLSITGRGTIPVGPVDSTPVQRRGSLLFDPRTLKIYYSDGVQWVEIGSSVTGGVCIQDADGDTSVCTDTIPETDADIIFFKADGANIARISKDGLVVGSAVLNPSTIAHLAGNIEVAGLISSTT